MRMSWRSHQGSWHTGAGEEQEMGATGLTAPVEGHLGISQPQLQGQVDEQSFGCLVEGRNIFPVLLFFFSASPPSSSPFSFPAALQQLV